jgi:hypothetical protein
MPATLPTTARNKRNIFGTIIVSMIVTEKVLWYLRFASQGFMQVS